MIVPNKVIIEITPEGYTLKVISSDGNTEWEQVHKMNGAHTAEAVSGCDIYDSKLSPVFDDLCEAIEDLSFGPFGVASVLHQIKADC